MGLDWTNLACPISQCVQWQLRLEVQLRVPSLLIIVYYFLCRSSPDEQELQLEGSISGSTSAKSLPTGGGSILGKSGNQTIKKFNFATVAHRFANQ